MSIPRRRSTNRRLPRPNKTKGRPARKAIGCRAWPSGPRTRTNPGRDSTSTSSASMPPWRSRRSRPCTTKSGRDRLLTIVLVRDIEGKRPDQMFYCTKLDWTARQILSAYACRWAIECTFENCKQFLGLEDPANRLPKAVERTAPMALFLYSLVVVWFHRTGSSIRAFPLPTLVPEEGRTVVRRHVDDPEAGQLRGENRETACEPVITENLDCPAHRASQPHRVIGLPPRIPEPRTTSRPIRRGEFHPPGRSRSAFKSAKLELRGSLLNEMTCIRIRVCPGRWRRMRHPISQKQKKQGDSGRKDGGRRAS